MLSWEHRHSEQRSSVSASKARCTYLALIRSPDSAAATFFIIFGFCLSKLASADLDLQSKAESLSSCLWCVWSGVTQDETKQSLQRRVPSSPPYHLLSTALTERLRMWGNLLKAAGICRLTEKHDKSPVMVGAAGPSGIGSLTWLHASLLLILLVWNRRNRLPTCAEGLLTWIRLCLGYEGCI